MIAVDNESRRNARFRDTQQVAFTFIRSTACKSAVCRASNGACDLAIIKAPLLVIICLVELSRSFFLIIVLREREREIGSCEMRMREARFISRVFRILPSSAPSNQPTEMLTALRVRHPTGSGTLGTGHVYIDQSPPHRAEVLKFTTTGTLIELSAMP